MSLLIVLGAAPSLGRLGEPLWVLLLPTCSRAGLERPCTVPDRLMVAPEGEEPAAGRGLSLPLLLPATPSSGCSCNASALSLSADSSTPPASAPPVRLETVDGAVPADVVGIPPVDIRAALRFSRIASASAAPALEGDLPKSEPKRRTRDEPAPGDVATDEGVLGASTCMLRRFSGDELLREARRVPRCDRPPAAAADKDCLPVAASCSAVEAAAAAVLGLRIDKLTDRLGPSVASGGEKALAGGWPMPFSLNAASTSSPLARARGGPAMLGKGLLFSRDSKTGVGETGIGVASVALGGGVGISLRERSLRCDG